MSERHIIVKYTLDNYLNVDSVEVNDLSGNSVEPHFLKGIQSKLNSKTREVTYLYFARKSMDERQSDGSHCIKVGITSNIERRMKEINQSGYMPFECAPWGRLAASNWESALHSMYTAAGMHNNLEWFNLKFEDVHYFKALYKKMGYQGRLHLLKSIHECAAILSKIDDISLVPVDTLIKAWENRGFHNNYTKQQSFLPVYLAKMMARAGVVSPNVASAMVEWECQWNTGYYEKDFMDRPIDPLDLL